MTQNAEYVPCPGCADPDPCGGQCDLWDCEICQDYYSKLAPMHPACEASIAGYHAERAAHIDCSRAAQ